MAKSSVSKASTESAKKSTEKYASKFAHDAISGIIKKKLASKIKNPKTCEKWLEKLKMSILRKISVTSKELFEVPELKEEFLVKKISSLKEAVRAKEQRIKNMHIERLRNGSIQEMPIRENSIPYNPGKFETHIKEINDRFGKLSELISVVHKEAKARVNSLRSVVHVVDSNWQQLRKSGELKTSTSTASEKLASVSSNSRIGNHVSVLESSKQTPLAALSSHLDSS